ncbi:MAG: hypothetical protein AAGG38_10215 [Planctomycetota bacterium]
MTMIEVVASLALLGGLLGAAVVAKGKLSRQWQIAQDRAEAVALLDTQVAAWHRGTDSDRSGGAVQTIPEHEIALHESGPLGDAGWEWRAQELTPDEMPALPIIRFTAHDLNDETLATIDVFASPEPSSERPTLLSAASCDPAYRGVAR